ncbi:carboxymuconolactone decarboxylase family protein [Alkalihalobacterium alkalinitrilicum]|uniref:carboxymuconolactone decarboxylase family protein n=1 Tax=Alkalihalobacterium alkalinitrilicum TaxID=427920 RepID=UPI000994F498|nr:carboxymuconolactone decarboxylase family protein [Alkalihalobacterium alkalinitrilicum]
MDKSLTSFHSINNTTAIEKMKQYNETIFNSYEKLLAECMKDGILSKKEKSLILVGVNAARRYEQGLLYHTKEALDLGASIEEIVDILTPCILSRGIPSWLEGIKAIVYAREYLGLEKISRTSSETKNVKQRIEDLQGAIAYFEGEANGSLPKWVATMLEFAPQVAQYYGSLRSEILRDHVISRKLKELVLVCINLVERYGEGARIHIETAKKLGATNEEIAEVAFVAMLAGGLPVWLLASDFL